MWRDGRGRQALQAWIRRASSVFVQINSIHAKGPSCRGKTWNRLWLDQRSIISPKIAEIPLFSCPVEMQQVGLIAGAIPGKPGIDVDDIDLVEHGEPVARGLPFVGDDGGNHVLIYGRLIGRAVSNNAGSVFHWTVCPKRCANRNRRCSWVTAQSMSISAPSRSPVSGSGISRVTTRIRSSADDSEPGRSIRRMESPSIHFMRKWVGKA
jgi:hypothetical protein